MVLLVVVLLLVVMLLAQHGLQHASHLVQQAICIRLVRGLLRWQRKDSGVLRCLRCCVETVKLFPFLSELLHILIYLHTSTQGTHVMQKTSLGC